MIEELILVRHGESHHIVEDISGGWTDTPLTERGQRQAQAVANRLFDMFDSRDFTLFSSDLMRASE
ncbi:MAG: histidine phosphatase family protein, partial [Candidatus Lokiarchaeota archaeon]|nr:histidine phosphatase family protein [Candidatus Lokiarchaeota archaeon]